MKIQYAIVIASLFASCTPKKESAETPEVIHETKRVHHYTYDSAGRILKDRLVSYIYSDSTVETITYSYDDSGRLSSLINEGEQEEVFYKKVFGYNSMDSLTQEFKIENISDTISTLEKQFDKNGRLTKEFRRDLFVMNAEDALLHQKPAIYDTIIFISEHSYKGGMPDQTVTKDGKGAIVKLLRYKHDNGLLSKKMSYSLMGKDTVLASTEYYSYSKGNNHPETLAISWQGDTIAILSRTLDGSAQLSKLVEENKEEGYVFVNFYEKGKLVDRIELLKHLDARMQYKYTYDKYGNIKSEIRDELPLTEEEKNAL